MGIEERYSKKAFWMSSPAEAANSGETWSLTEVPPGRGAVGGYGEGKYSAEPRG